MTSPVTVGLLLLASCSAPVTDLDDWRSPGGACHEVNLLDGLDADSSEELDALFACINRGGGYDPLLPLVEALRAETRSGQSGVAELSAWISELISSRWRDWLASLESLRSQLSLSSGTFLRLSWLSLEWIYAASEPSLAAGEVPLNHEGSLSEGIVVPLLPVFGSLVSWQLDEDLSGLHRLEELLRSEALLELLHGGQAWNLSPWSEELGQLREGLVDLRERTLSPESVLWEESRGDSLRDLTRWSLEAEGDLPRAELLLDAIHPVLASGEARVFLQDMLRELSEEDLLLDLPPQVRELARVRPDGAARSLGDESAWHSLTRLLHEANQPLSCSLDGELLGLEFTLWELDLDNLAVALLRQLAEDPSLADRGLAITEAVLGLTLGETILDQIVSSGMCPALTEQLVEDLYSLERLSDPSVPDLLDFMLSLLSAFYQPALGHDQLQELVDLISKLHELSVLDPVTELLLDVGTSPLVYDLLELLPPLLNASSDPDLSQVQEPGVPLDLDWLWARGLAWLDAGDASSRAGVWRGLSLLTEQEAFWETLPRILHLVADEEAISSRWGEAWTWVVEVDPDLERASSWMTAASDGGAAPLLRILELEEFSEALSSTYALEEGPLPFWSRLVAEDILADALDGILHVLDWLEL